MTKPRLIEVTGPELALLLSRREALDVPFVIEAGGWYAKAEELRVWRESERAKEAEHG